MNVLKKYFSLYNLKKKDIYIRSNVNFNKTKFEGKNKIGRDTDIAESTIGFGTYIGDDCYLRQTKIGRFCSIGSWVRIISGNHPLTYVTTHPIAFDNSLKKLGLNSPKTIPFIHNPYVSENYYVEIGNDVWVGQGVSILNGVKIGDGAVLAAGAVILKDVPPYSIVGGVPGKIIKMRFDDNTIQDLLEIKFWNKDLSWIKNNADKLSNVSEFIKFCKDS